MIIAELAGGLGNQMFQYVLGRHLSILNNDVLLLDKTFLLDRRERKEFVYRDFDLSIFDLKFEFVSDEISSSFNMLRSKSKKIKNKIFPYQRIKYVAEQTFLFNPNVLRAKGDIYLNGYFQNIKYFENIENVVRKDFSLNHIPFENSKEIVHLIETTESICINFRRSDFVSNSTHGVLPMEYYQNALQIIKKTVKKPVVFIFSDDIEWCIENVKFDCEMYFVSHEHKGEKFARYMKLMMSCKHFIIPNSSFAWWCAYLSPNPSKVVVAPKIWLHPNIIETKNMSPVDWKIL